MRIRVIWQALRVPPSADQEMDRRSLAVLSAGHACVDVCQGAIPALLPFMVIRRGYSYSEATALLLVMTFSSSMLQPLFGFVSDRRSLAWLLPGGILLGGTGIAVLGLTESYPATLIAVSISGIGVGAYHPEGARFANYVAGGRRATGMSFYAVGGNLGFALGPVVVTALVLPFGLGGLVWVALPMAVATVALATELPRLVSFRPDVGNGGSGSSRGRTITKKRFFRPVDEPARDRWLPFSGVATIAGFRSATYFALQAFVPLWFIRHLDESAAIGNGALTVLLLSGAIGTLVGGRVADRIGMRRVIMISLAVTTPLVLLFLVLGAIPAAIVLGVTGFFMVGTFSITVVLGQEYLPNRIGLASGVTLGAAIGFGGLAAWLLGLLADQTGLLTVLLVTAALPLPGLLVTMMLPDSSGRKEDPTGGQGGSRRREGSTAGAGPA